MKPFVEVKNLSVIYNLGKSNEVVALSDVSLEIYPGEYIIFFGPSGCGKSTLLYSIAGLQVPTRGNAVVAGQDVARMTKQEIVNYRRLTIGLIFQNFNLIPTLNILDNVLLPNIFGGLIPGISVKKAKRILEKFGILDLSCRYPSELSGGQQQRVAIARALIYNPPLLLADEPTGNLDSASAKTVMDTLYELNKKFSKTIILVTHDPFWLDYAHRIFHMKDGQVIRQTINRKRAQIRELSPEELRVSSGAAQGRKKRKPRMSLRPLVYYLLNSFDKPIIERLEKAIKKRISGKIDSEKLKEILDRPFEEGGVGLYRQTAESLAQKIERFLAEMEFEKKEAFEGTEKEGKARRLRRFLLEGWQGSLKDFVQLERLDSAIRQRIEKKIDRRGFQKFLDLPVKKGGVGLDRRTARNFARKLETIITSQGPKAV